ncbi:chromodomain-helicase-DNA-binding protein 8 [Oncorhynchus tshawytscha]|uniref:chromodomain-helicase-DNA-binding protein 8 n=1 Tax=Oncorhynchus tshawytscha TaxID=74940 RepID=UPI000D0998C0|nr:chromodomain-helicase-DNA-binding protein 8 [Oncorhynchus tshawytscha]XP_024291853.1 chromodomain-helicase-DNA-binding protein 8 [Oncorhynchus tshawytscha]XP_024291854.1 chromodomain-helicase-DNA-binding protein 8 [Oncorhynchus tshawytscha]XP_024291855.1 chromodomain-helicase-DNA-binding protein 8 [Oncorhynchus tshawytscha]
MADPIMDLFDDTPLFNLDALPDDAFTDPVEEALKLALGQVDPPSDPTPDLSTPALSIPVAAPTIPDPVPVQQPAPVPVALPQTVSIATTVPQTTLSVASNTSGAATVLLSSPLTVNSSTGTTQHITTQQFTTQQLTQIAQQLTPQQLAAITQQAGGQGGAKIVILKGPGGQAQLLQTVAGTGSQAGKVTFARVLSGTQLRPGMQILSGGTVLNQASPGQVKVGTGVQRLVQSPNGPLKQVQLISIPQGQSQSQTQTVQVQIPQAQLTQAQAQVQLQTQGQATQIQLQPQTQVQLQSAMQTQVTAAATGTTTVRPQGVTLTTVPQQGEAKRITLVLQQPQGGAAQGGAVTVGGSGQLQQGQQQRLVLGNLPGKLVLQGGQLAALTQARAGQTGTQPKVLTIQLQVQQQPNQQGGPKFQLVSGGQGSSPQVVQISQGQGGQRLAVPLKLLLQPQTNATSTAGRAVSVVKVINTSAAGSTPSTTTTMSSPGIRLAKAQEPVRRLETLCKQEKANRIVAEAIARAKARGERNIPRVLNQDELPAGQKAADQGAAATTTGTPGAKKKGGGSKKKSPAAAAGKGGAGAEKKGKAKAAGGAAGGTPGGAAGNGCSKSKSKAKINTITLVGGKKRKRNASSDHSDGELSPASPSKALDEDMLAKRRSNRQVKRKKYTEDLDIKITDDEDEPEEDVDVTTTTTAAVASITGGATGQLMGEQLKQELQLDGDSLSSMQFFVENPNEEDAAIVDKVLSMRLTKKEVSPGHYINAEEFFVKYKNYSYMHCEWATLEQLERDKRIHQKLKRFKAKHAQMRHLLQEEEEPFNPDYVEVDRILDESNSVDNGEPVVYYLVKWCSLPYEDATWELREDVDEGKVEEFRKIQDRQPQLKRTPRPQAAAWKKLEEFREYKSGNVLREYQLEGVNWLLFNWYNRQNCILADEMGLGKTIQSISLLSEVFGAGVQGPFLVIAPLSTITNWEREFAIWTDMNAIVYHGSLASRQMIQQYEMYCKDDKDHLIPGAYKFDALITTFEMILSDCPELREISWRCVIIDEAHRLKNRNCKLLDSLKMLDLEHKVLLTGTPLQNTVEELFSLLHFLEPAQFSSESEFLRDFGDLKTEEQVQKLQAILKPMMLRRLKEDVEKNLAPKQETIIEVELTDVQKKYYRAILERNFSFLSMGATSNSNVPNLLNTMMELRKCCNHPYLITGAEEKIVAELRDVYNPVAPDFHLQALVRSAGKLVLLDKLLPRLKAGGHKVLIFSQMVRCLDILEDYLINKRYLYERIDGRVRGNLRQAAIDRFSKPDSDRFVFLLCTRAGGLGINLTAADTCVIFDSDWNPQNDLQAQARCHRIGQSKAVKVYRLITRNSYEREMLDKASLKLGLDRAVLQSMSGNKESNVNGQIQQFSKKEIEDLLRKGAYAAIMDEEDEGSKFCEEDIDQILQRRATTITIESEGKGSTFSKASFVATENRTDIALDDPEFWQKWAKRADIDFDSMNRKNTLVIDTPRVRKQTRQFATLRGEGGEISDPDSDDEYPPANSRQSRSSRRSERHTGNGYGRTDCFRVEKHLLVYGWGRWRDILSHARCKRRLGERDVETICRVILVFCLLHYRGDENIKSFIWELITPPENGREPHTLLNHSGLSIPVPRGRKGKRVKAQSSFDVQKVEWIRKYNPDSLLLDDSYRKHLKHQCNKVLLRVRMLYYLRQEVIGEHADSVLRGADARDIDIWMPEMEQLEVPSGWWDTEADRSLLVGVFKHGYEMYTTMRADDCLCFLERAGRPDDQAIDAEQHSADAELGDGGDDDKYSEDPEFKPALRHTKDLYEEADSLNMDDDICVEDKALPVKTKGPPSGQFGACEWPTSSSLTARLRRLITAYQRSYRREQLKVEAAEKGDRRRRRCEQASKLKEIARQERQQRWTRREECDFYRVVSTFGVERIKKEADTPEGEEAELGWARFRTFARLEKKTDESLSRYFRCFMAMCRRVCNLRPASGEDPSELGQSLAPITEERASRTLYRISLLRRLREHVLPHPSLEELLLLAPPSSELPAWWSTPAHDRELMLGSALHGVSRTELSVFLDPQFSFSQARHDYLENQQNQPAPATPLLQPQAEEGSVVKEEEGLDKESRILGASEALGHSDTQITHLSRPDGKGRARTGLGWKKSRGRGPRSGGNKGERSVGGISDSDSDSDSGSSTSSQRSGSSDDSGDSETERERAALKMEEDGENSLLSMTPSQDGAPPESLTDPFRVDWPKDRVLINRLDSLCTLVLSGQWPTGRRYASDAQLNPGSDDLGAGDELSFARLMRKGNSTPGGEGADRQESEFTVKLLKEEGLKLTFSKHALMSNGSGGEGSGRRKRRDQELSDPDGAVPVVDAMTGTVLSGERAPRRRDLPNWLKENPDYEVEGDMLELLVNQKRRRRKKRTEKTAALLGSEKVKIIDMRTGKKVGATYGPMLQDLRVFLEENPDCAVAPEWAEMVQSSGFLPDSLFHRLLSARSVIPKRVRRHHHHHHHHAPQPAPLEDPVLGGGVEETLVSDGAYMMEDEDLENSPFLTQAFEVKMEGGDSLSQGGYESSDREALLDDVIMAQKDSDSSSSSED